MDTIVLIASFHASKTLPDLERAGVSETVSYPLRAHYTFKGCDTMIKSTVLS